MNLNQIQALKNERVFVKQNNGIEVYGKLISINNFDVKPDLISISVEQFYQAEKVGRIDRSKNTLVATVYLKNIKTVQSI